MKLQHILEKHWYVKLNLILTILLILPCIIFFIISKTRYYLYKFNILKSYKLTIPVIILGNISVGGVGKTPLTKSIALQLQNSGKKVGIILRGYKSTNSLAKIVTPDCSSLEVGDEALIYANNNLKVSIGKDRYQAGLKLLEQYPDLDIIISDDGLQHYKLNRDFEIAVIDAKRLFGNGFVLPMGPLRESKSRLKSVNALVCSGTSNILKDYGYKLYSQETVLDKVYNPLTNITLEPINFKNKNICAMAAIGNPEKFFAFLEKLGIDINHKLAMPDHHHYKAIDIPNYEIILTTEKDYTKLAKFNNPNIWVVLVKAQLSSNSLFNQINKLIC